MKEGATVDLSNCHSAAVAQITIDLIVVLKAYHKNSFKNFKSLSLQRNQSTP